MKKHLQSAQHMLSAGHVTSLSGVCADNKNSSRASIMFSSALEINWKHLLFPVCQPFTSRDRACGEVEVSLGKTRCTKNMRRENAGCIFEDSLCAEHCVVHWT